MGCSEAISVYKPIYIGFLLEPLTGSIYMESKRFVCLAIYSLFNFGILPILRNLNKASPLRWREAFLDEGFLEVPQMSSATEIRPASERQLSYLRNLRAELGYSKPVMEGAISSSNAFQKIDELLSRAKRSAEFKEKQPGGVDQNEVRLGMVLKEVYRINKAFGRDVLGRHRTKFMEEAIETYELFSQNFAAMGERSAPLRGDLP